MIEYNDLPEYIKSFSGYLLGIKNLSELYVTNIVSTVKQFLEFINIHIFNNKYENINKISLNDLRSLTSSDVYSYLFYLAENHYKTNTRITKTKNLKVFFNYLYTIKRELFKEPFKKIKTNKRTNQKLPNYLSLEESKKVLSTYKDATSMQGVRNNAMLHLFLNSGLRLSELVSLNISDINLKTNTFTIIGKGNKERTGYLNESTKKALIKYIEIRKKINVESKKDKNALFISSQNSSRINKRTIRKIVKKVYHINNIKDTNYSVHTLRHTCATLLYKAGTNIKTIQELLGHVQVNTTEIYTHLYDEELEKEMLSHPLSKFKIVNALNYNI